MRPILVLNPAPFERLCAELELRVVEVQLAKAVSIADELRRRDVPHAHHLARVDDGEVLCDLARGAAEVLANRGALREDLMHHFDL